MQHWCSSVKHSWQLVSALSAQKVNSSSSASAKCLPRPSRCCPDAVSASAAFSSGLSRDGSKKPFNLWSQSLGPLSVTESWQPLPTHPTHPTSAGLSELPATHSKQPGPLPAAALRRAVGMMGRTRHPRACPTHGHNQHGTAVTSVRYRWAFPCARKWGAESSKGQALDERDYLWQQAEAKLMDWSTQKNGMWRVSSFGGCRPWLRVHGGGNSYFRKGDKIFRLYVAIMMLRPRWRTQERTFWFTVTSWQFICYSDICEREAIGNITCQ